MCDTLVLLPPLAAPGTTLFAKNSDREPNEPNIPVRIPGRKYGPGDTLRCTYIEIEQVPATYDVFLVKPAWMWGAEMGVNEHAVAVGNEALFCRSKAITPALTGMDLVRLALERARSAREAVKVIVSLLERYGQGGNCGYQRKLHYHNSFLAADPSSAWLVETAGRCWAVKQVSTFMTISNAFTLREDYDDCTLRYRDEHPEVPVDFKKTWEHPLITRIARGEHRQRASEQAVRRFAGQITPQQVMTTLREHAPDDQNRLFRHRTFDSLCMHAGGPFSTQTTGSLVVELSSHNICAWFTGSSLPCISLFKPFRFTHSISSVEQYASDWNHWERFWTKRERFHRLILEHRGKNLAPYLAVRDALEAEIIEQSRLISGGIEAETLLRDALKREEELIDTTAALWKTIPSSLGGNPFFKLYWARQNRLMNRSAKRVDRGLKETKLHRPGAADR